MHERLRNLIFILHGHVYSKNQMFYYCRRRIEQILRDGNKQDRSKEGNSSPLDFI